MQRYQKKHLFILIVMFLFLTVFQASGLPIATAQDEEPDDIGCAISDELLDGQGRYSLTGLGRYSLTGLSRYTLTGLGRYSLTGLEGPSEEELEIIQNNTLVPGWLTGAFNVISNGQDFNTTRVAVLIVDDHDDTEATDEREHGELVREVFDELFEALPTTSIDFFNVNIGGDMGYRIDLIAQEIDAVINGPHTTYGAGGLRGEPYNYTHFVINMSFGLLPCVDDFNVGDTPVPFSFYDFIDEYNSRQNAEPVVNNFLCLTANDDESYTAHFAYTNPNDFPVHILYDEEENYLAGGGLSQEVIESITPQYFGVPDNESGYSGDYPTSAFQVVFYGDDPLSWTLLGNTVTAYPGESPYCDVVENEPDNLVRNGSFERPDVTNRRGWDVYGSSENALKWEVEWTQEIPCGEEDEDEYEEYYGKRPAFGDYDDDDDDDIVEEPVVEIQRNLLTDAVDGLQYAELDSDCQGPGGGGGVDEQTTVRISQTLETVPGAWYQFSFWVQGRTNAPEGDALTFSAFWNGEPVIADEATTRGEWTQYSFEVQATGEETVIAFEDTGTPNSFGVFLDDVVVTALYPVVNILECVTDNLDGTFTAHFGYDNLTDAPLTIPYDDDYNALTGGGLSNAQLVANTPQYFGYVGSSPSQPNSAFQVVFDGTNLSWTLFGNEVTADADSDPCNLHPTTYGQEVVDYGLYQYLVEVLGLDYDQAWMALEQLLTDPSYDPLMADLFDLLSEYMNLSCNVLPCPDGVGDVRIIAVASSGNFADFFPIGDPAPPLAPARWPMVVAAGATLGDDGPVWELSQDSNFLISGCWFKFDDFGENFYACGTSFSAPYVSMIAALYLTYPDACLFDGTNAPLNDPFDYSNPTFSPTGPLNCHVPPFESNLSIVKTSDPETVVVGDEITYTLRVTNNGPSVATGVTVVDTLPASVNFVSASPGCTHDSGEVTCDVGELAVDGFVEITITVETTEPGVISNSATAASEQQDPDGAVSAAETTVNPPPTCEPNPEADLDHSSSFLMWPYDQGVIVNQSDLCSYEVGIASYIRFGSDVSSQIPFDHNLYTIEPGQTLYLEVDLPGCDAQVDLFYGDYIDDFATGARYGDRLIDSRWVELGVLCETEEPEQNDPPQNDPPANDPPQDDPPANDPPQDDPPQEETTCDPNEDASTVLSGVIIDLGGNQYMGRVDNTGTCDYEVGLASYERPDDQLANQVLFDSDPDSGTGPTAPAGGSVNLYIEIPDCATQVDLFFHQRYIDGSESVPLVLPDFSTYVYGSRLLASWFANGDDFCVEEEPVSQPPQNDPPVNDPPQNDPPQNDPPQNDPPVNDPPQNDPTVCVPNPQVDLNHDGSHLNSPPNTGTVTNLSASCTYEVGIASYRKFNENIGEQELFDYSTVTVGPGETVQLAVTLPDCATQIDLFYGAVITDFSTGERYNERLLDVRHLGGTDYCDGIVLGTGDIQFTVTWDNNADVDLRVIEPNGTRIWFGDRTPATSQGQLDVDSNWTCGTNLFYTENIFWPIGQSPDGTYVVEIHRTSSCGFQATWRLVVRVDNVVVLDVTDNQDRAFQIDVGGGAPVVTPLSVNVAEVPVSGDSGK